MTTLPTGTVTFLFTDLEGSTRLWDTAPRAMEVAVPRHDQIVTDAIERNRGTVFKQVGDGLCAAFDDAVAAVTAAVEAQRALADEPWPSELDEPLRARMGLHTGTARAQDGDYLGPALNRVARLMGAGHGGQVLVSGATERLVRDALSDEVQLLDLGQHRLRDLATPEQVFQVCHSGLPSQFPPVRTVESLPGNLPLQVSSFVGRGEQLEQLAARVLDERLVTLTGVGGVGKTRLALQAATEVLPRYLDGAWLVELAPVGEPDAVPHAVASVIGAQEMPNRTVTESVVEALRPRQTLLIFDNCEHLLDAAGALAEQILRACPRVTIVTTSREPLAVAGEQVWPVTSLQLPPREALDAPHELARFASVSLFVDRAQASRRDFALTADNASAVAEICRRLDGLPLALELAAARVRSMAPAEIAERLDERFRLLRSGRRTAMERHQTLRATVEWSYELLTDDEKQLFDRLSVFAGGFILVAAERICSDEGIDEFDIADLVAGLTEKSMLGIEEQPDGTTRYTMLETIRQFGEEQLLERGEANEVGGRHCEYYAELAARAGEGVRGQDELRWVLVCEAEFDNLRAAHAWAMANVATAPALGLAVDLIDFASWRLRGEVFAWLVAALELPGAEDDRRYAEACAGAAMAAAFGGRFELAEELASRSLSLAPESRRAPYAWYAAGVRGFSEGSVEASERFANGRACAEAAGDMVGAAFTTAADAMIRSYRGEVDVAERLAEEARGFAEQTRNPTARSLALYTIGEVLQETDPEQAVRALTESIELARGVHNRFGLGIALVTMATVAAKTGDMDASLRTLIDAIKEFRRRGAPRQTWVTLRNVVERFDDLGRHEQAAVLYGATESETAVGEAWGPQAQRLAAVRARFEAALGDRSEEAVGRGVGMTEDEAIEFALAELRGALAERASAASGAA